MSSARETKHIARVLKVESQWSFANGQVDRLLIITVKGSPPLWVLGPNVQTDLQVNEKHVVLRLTTDEEWSVLAAALKQGSTVATWWESDGEIQQLIVSASWDPAKTRGASAGAGIGVGLAFPMS